MNFKQYLNESKNQIKLISEHITKAYADAIMVPLNKIGDDSGARNHLGRSKHLAQGDKDSFLKYIQVSKRIMRQNTGEEKARIIWPIVNSGAELQASNTERKIAIKSDLKSITTKLYNIDPIYRKIGDLIGEYIAHSIAKNIDDDLVFTNSKLLNTLSRENNRVSAIAVAIFIHNTDGDFSEENKLRLNRLLSNSGIINNFLSRISMNIQGYEISDDYIALNIQVDGLSFLSHTEFDYNTATEELLQRGLVGSEVSTAKKTHEVIAREHNQLNLYINNLIENILADTSLDFRHILESACINLKRTAAEVRKRNDTLFLREYMGKLVEFKSIYDSEEPDRISAKLQELSAIQNPNENIIRKIQGLQNRLNALSNGNLSQIELEIQNDNNSRYDLVISNLPHDIIGMSTNKSWGSCQNTMSQTNIDIFKDFIDDLLDSTDDIDVKKQIVRDLLADPAAKSFYSRYNQISTEINGNRFNQRDIVNLFGELNGSHGTYANSHARVYENAHGAVIVLYVIPHVKKYVSGVLKDTAQYEQEVASALKSSHFRITLLPAKSTSANKLTFIPGEYATGNSTNITNPRYGEIPNMTSSERTNMQNLMVKFYQNQGLTKNDVSHDNIHTFECTGTDWYYNQGSINAHMFDTRNYEND